MFDEGWDGTDVRVSAVVTFVIGLVTVALLLHGRYLSPTGEGANIGLGAFVLLVAVPAAVWAYVTTIVATVLIEVGAGWQLLSMVATLLLVTPWIAMP